MKSVKKESRLRIPASRFLEAAELIKERKRAKVPEQLTPPVQEEPEPVSSVLQGGDILALAIKKEDLKKQHIPRFIETQDRPVVTQKFIIRKLKPKDHKRKVCHLVAYPATPDAATKPLDYSGPGDSFHGCDQILPHHILGSLQDFKRIAVARGNIQLAELIHTPPCLVTLISAKEEPKQKAPKEEKEKAHPWAPPPQHNFLRNWRRNLALRKQQQEALSERLKKPVGELLMHTGETYRQIQEERELIDRTLPTQHDGKSCEETSGFWSRLEYLGDEMTGLVMTKTKAQRGLLEPITHVRKPHCIQMETGLPAQKDAWYRYTWDRSLFLIYRRKELQSVMAELDFSQQDIDGLEVVGRGQPFSTVTVEDYPVFDRSQESSSEDTGPSDSLASYPDDVPMPVLGPSLLFCGKPACWIRGRNPEDTKRVGIAVRLTFETLEREKTSSELTVVNNGTVAIWYNWRRRSQLDSFQDLKRNRMERFYFNNREGVILPGETKTFTFFFKSLNAGIFRECWEFGTHPALLGGALLQVNLHAVSLTQDVFREERKLLKDKLAAHEAVTIVDSVLQELLSGILTPERAPSPVDAYLTEEDLFRHRNPQAVMALPEESQREDALIGLNKAALELCQEPRPLQSDLLHQMCLQLWRDVIDGLVGHSLWLRALLGLPEKETIYLDLPEEQDGKSPPVTEVKVTAGKVGKEDRKGAAQEKKQLGIREKEDRKPAKLPGKEDRLNSKKHKAKDDKKPLKSSSRDRVSLEDPAPDSTMTSQEPIDPLVMKKYTKRLHTEVYGLLDTLVTDLMVLADELRPIKNVEETLHLCI
ncbi:MYCBP-associated protein isoform X5 [Panthera tigris]|uniref:MYCBP-associated protein isoform X5 n=1 Tax=Panthera tigris TaxID=9694 RepID=UPI001C6F90E8|nr:MYCBP-associated protein isoform X5 [Panthera tigris]